MIGEVSEAWVKEEFCKMYKTKEHSVVTLTADQIISTTAIARSFKDTRKKAQDVPLFVTNAQGDIDTVLIGFQQFEEMSEIIQEHIVLLEELEIASRLKDIDTNPDHFVNSDDVFASLDID